MSSYKGIFTKAGINVIKLDFDHALEKFELFIQSGDALRNSITKLDCSDLNPDCRFDLQNWGSEGSSTNIVFPQRYALKNVGFECFNSMVLENFTLEHQSKTTASSIYIKWGRVDSLADNFKVPMYDGVGTGMTFTGSETENDILRKMINTFLKAGWIFDYDSPVRSEKLVQVGSIHNPWNFEGVYYPFTGCTQLQFVSFSHETFESIFTIEVQTELKELIFHSWRHIAATRGPFTTTGSGTPPERWPSIDILVLDMPGYSLQERASWGFNPYHPTKVYIPTGWNDEDKANLQNRLANAWTLHQYDSLDEIPFQYAPTDEY